MDVILVSTSEIEGGAARAASRLHKGLLAAGIHSTMMVQNSQGDGPNVVSPQSKLSKGMSSLRPTLEMLPLYLVGKTSSQFSTAWFPDRQADRLRSLAGDLINLQWINKGFIRLESLKKIPKPLVWTLYDMWAFTGGCHYAYECEGYVARCGQCPQLNSHKELDLSRWVWTRKQRAWGRVEMALVCPSKWMADCASRSSLFAGRRIEVIANGLDIQRFRPIQREEARNWLGLPVDKKLILFSAVKGVENPQKGYPFFHRAMQDLAAIGWQEQVEVLVLGSSEPVKPAELPVPVHYLGHLKDELSLALVYGAADVFVAPSLQDNLPNTVMEALACGTPCVAFNTGGIPEMVDNQVSGYLAIPKDAQDLAQGIDWVLRDPERWRSLGQQARLKAERDFDGVIQAKKYASFYTELLESSPAVN